jgi:DNA-binding NarL/FixJ family response regulator
MQDTVKLIVVEDQQLFREGLIALLKKEERLDILFEAEHGQDCIAKIEALPDLPHIALIDLEMPVMNGIELNAYLQQNYPTIKVIMLSGHAKERLIAKMIQEGASGYLFKNCERQELINAIFTTAAKGFYINDDVLKAIQSNSQRMRGHKGNEMRDVEFTQREIEVLKLLCKEMSNTEIAETLFISPRTVEGHRNNLSIIAEYLIILC